MPRRQRPTLDRLTKDAFGRLERTRRTKDGYTYTSWNAAEDTAMAVESPGATLGRLIDEDPHERPKDMNYIGGIPDQGSHTRDMDYYARKNIEVFIRYNMHRRCTAKQRKLIDERNDAWDRELSRK